jgi:hypothetical protein
VNTFSPVSAALLGVFLALSWVTSASAAPGQSFEAAKNHWSYQPIRRPTPPKVKSEARVQSPIDAFLLAPLERNGLAFAPGADKRTLLRRAYYDLIGLPPTFAEIQAFERDRSPNAFSNVVEHLLAFPRYGECWGRHWLDVARYADTKDLVLSYGKDALRPYAYTYRDYVVRAFNEDLPFNRFVQDQLAADLVSPQVPRWRLAALGFLTLGRLFDNNPHDEIDDQIDTTTRGFLGLTVACARCHDHKYDAITQRDYYALYGVFASTERPYNLPLLEDPKEVPGGLEFENQLSKARDELEQHIDAEFAKLTEIFRQRIGDYLVRAATTKPDLWETTQFPLSLTPDDFRPVLMLRTRHFLEQRATPGDHVFGPWVNLINLPDENFAAKALEMLSNSAHLTNVNSLIVAGLRKASLTNKAAVARAYGQVLVEVYEQSKKPVAGSSGLNAEQQELLELVVGKESPVWFPRRDAPDHMSRPEKDRYNGLVANLDKIAANATNPPPARAMVVADLPEPLEPHIFKRGNPSRPGEAVPRAFPQVLGNGQPSFTKGSGRLELAHAIVSPTNPLTARVFVNRVWMHHFGEPLVRSTTDFGTRSDPPANPELLDWLASEFVRSGWSIKHLHRVLMLSSAYQQASTTTDINKRDAPGRISANIKNKAGHAKQSPPAFPHSTLDTRHSSLRIDPENKLLWHFPRRRLDFEAMRDSLLFISGRLDVTIGGRPVDLTADPLNRRRTLYGLVDRQDLPALFRAFDFPVPDQCIERRPHTSVPQQALFALNSPFVMEQARAVAARPEVTLAPNINERVDGLFRIVFGRHSTKPECAEALKFVNLASSESLPDNGLNSWEQLAQVLLISNEAVFID